MLSYLILYHIISYHIISNRIISSPQEGGEPRARPVDRPGGRKLPGLAGRAAGRAARVCGRFSKENTCFVFLPDPGALSSCMHTFPEINDGFTRV